MNSQQYIRPITVWLAFGTFIALALRGLARRHKLLVKLPGPSGGSWIAGHFLKMRGVNGIKYQEGIVSTYGPTIRMDGPLGADLLYTIDPAIMHTVLVKEKAKFERAKGAALMIRSIFGGGLVGLTGEEHRIQRKLLTPVFTMKYLQELMPVFMDIAKKACQGIKKDLVTVNNSSDDVDVFPWATAAALELIGEAGLGYSFDALTRGWNEYSVAMKSVGRAFNKLIPFIPVLPYVYRIGTPSFRRWALNYVPFHFIRQLRRAVQIQNEQAEEIVRARQALLASGADLSSEAGRGRDLMTLLMKANEAQGSESYIDRQAMIGHMNIFIFAGHETTSTAIARVLDVLANRPQIQTRLREEIRQYFESHQDGSNYEGLLELPYLDAVVRETLRLYSPALNIFRVCQEDTTLPLEFPVETSSGKVTSIPVKKGTRVMMNIVMANRYSKIWGERAHEFWPERWIGSKIQEVTEPGARLPGVYSSMMTFGAGSYSCIGFKFAVMEIKVMISQLLTNFKFEPSEEEFAWESAGIQFPYLKKDSPSQDRLPKLPLRVTEL